jgi:choice-of-anchor B domain-containing protein
VLWRDVKVDGNYAFIVSEHRGHGVQVFDLTKLRGAVPGTVFTADAVYRGQDDTGQTISNSHNIGINPETDFAYAVGTNTCDALGATGENGGLHTIDISDPENPTFAGCARVTDPPTNSYVHDVECVVYRGPDVEHRGKEICFGSNENVVTIYDVTDKSNPVVLSQTTYPTAAYTHQGWLTADQRFFLFGDELDEGLGAGVEDPEGRDVVPGTVGNTTTYIMRVLDLDNPEAPKAHTHDTEAIDHNMYIDDGLVYQSNYTAGVRILDFTNASLRRGELNEVGYFDTFPAGDPVDPNQFAGTWSNYAFFDSGIVVATAIESGTSTLYVLRPTGEAAGGDGGGGDGGGDPGGGGDGDDDGDDDDGGDDSDD